MDELQPRDRLVTMTFTVQELAYIAGAVVVVGDRHELLDRIHGEVFEDDAQMNR